MRQIIVDDFYQKCVKVMKTERSVKTVILTTQVKLFSGGDDVHFGNDTEPPEFLEEKSVTKRLSVPGLGEYVAALKNAYTQLD